MKQLAVLGAAVVALGLGIKLAGVAQAAPATVDGFAMSRAPVSSEVTVVAQVVEVKKASDGRPLLVIDVNGVRSIAYVADDANPSTIEAGQTYQLRATVAGAGFLTVLKPSAVTPVVQAYDEPARAQVRSGYAYVYGQDTVMPSELPDGDYDGYLHVVSDRVSFVSTVPAP